MFEDKLVDHSTYVDQLNDLNESCAFWFAQNSADPQLIVKQNGLECWIDKAGEVSGMHAYASPYVLLRANCCLSSCWAED